MAQAALLGGLFIGILSALPLIKYCCCIWIIGGGLVAAYVDQQNDPRPITAGRGALAGLLSGVTGSFVWLVATVALNALFEPLRNQLSQAARFPEKTQLPEKQGEPISPDHHPGGYFCRSRSRISGSG